jgi:hypothetical protein
MWFVGREIGIISITLSFVVGLNRFFGGISEITKPIVYYLLTAIYCHHCHGGI